MPGENERSDQESLELDKLNVVVDDTSSPETDHSAQDSVEKGKSPEKPPGVARRFLGLFADKRFFLSFIVGMVITGAVFFITPIYEKFSESNNKKTGIQGRITYFVSAPVGFKYHVKFKLLVPFKEIDEKRILLEKLPKIRPELIGLGKNPNVSKSFREKDLDAIKAAIISVANQITGISVTELELTDLALE